MIEISKILGLIIFSALKFFIAPAAVVLVGYDFLATFIITSVGGVLGFIVFFKFGKSIKKLINSLLNPTNKPTPRFTYRNRTIVKIKRKYGFYGLALLTPCILGVPIGAFLAAAYFGKQKRTIPLFLGSILLWSLILTTISLEFKEL